MKALPPYAQFRLLHGRRAALRGPRSISSLRGSDVQCLAGEFILESLRIDLRHLGKVQCLKHGLYTYEAIMSSMHTERALWELNPTSQSVNRGLVSVIDAFLPGGASRKHVHTVVPHVFIAALTVRRMGGHGFAKRYLAVLAEAARCWRRRHGEYLPPLILPDDDSSALSCRRRGVQSCLEALQHGWSPRSLRTVAMTVADEIRSEGKERPVRIPHLPHKAVGNNLAEFQRHWDEVDWHLAHLLAPALASALAPAPASGSAARYPGCLSDAARIGINIRTFGGTEFCFQTPVLDVAHALQHKKIPFPSDWETWAPPGPGCRAALFQMRPRWQRERDGEIMDRAVYADSKSQAAAAYKDDLAAFHAHFIRKNKKTLDDLQAMFPQPRKWLLRDSQSSLCAFSRYLKIRQAIVEPSTHLKACRMYDKVPTWPVW